MSQHNEQDFVEKLVTGIPGFDLLSEGGLPAGRTSLVVGTAGSGKTVFACQFLIEGIKRGENGVFVTLEETPQSLRKNMRGFGWDIRKLEEEGKWVFVDASPLPGEKPFISGDYDFGSLLVRIEYAINQVNAKRVTIDSLGAIFTYLPDKARVRNNLFLIASTLRQIETTAIITSERNQEYGEISTHGVEEFVSDNVIILRNTLVNDKRRRTIEILKYRGGSHQQGEYPFTILPEQGIVIISLSTMTVPSQEGASNNRITSGNTALDAMCGGGFFSNSIILISGATGTGKTLMTTQFMAVGANNNERSLLLAFEENREQLFRNALGWGYDFAKLEREGKLKVVFRYPDATRLEDHLVRMREIIDEFQPQRVAIDSLSALERVSNDKGFREFIAALNSIIRERRITAMYTATAPTLVGGSSTTETHISTSTDLIILLRYIEVYGEIRRGLAVIKMRGSGHAKEIREFTIDNQGMHISKPFRNFTGILAGNPVSIDPSELDRLTELFQMGER
jgi:circadian clock protein KaiC